jgi:hypothetical protein
MNFIFVFFIYLVIISPGESQINKSLQNNFYYFFVTVIVKEKETRSRQQRYPYQKSNSSRL